MTRLRLSLLALALAVSLALPGAALAWVASVRIEVPPAPHRHAGVPVGVEAVRYAKRFLGVPYVWGGSTPSGFDCSGFVRYVYAHFGVTLPHSSYADFDLGRRVARGRLRPGDLVFFDGVGHVGMYVGGGRFIHAPHSGTSVQISSLAGYGAEYDGARRVLHGR